MFDKYYTESKLAEKLVNILPNSFEPSIIADFAAGEGSLLKAAHKKWQKSILLANDFCLESIISLDYLSWETYNLDFLNSNEVNRSDLMKFANKIDLVLLNPPFNQKKTKLVDWEGCTENISSGVALYFVFKSMYFLKPNGYLLAILPNGCLTSDRDQSAYKFLSRNYTLEVITENCDSHFKDASPRVSIVSIKNTRPDNFVNITIKESVKSSRLDIVRGNIQMHRIKSNTDPKKCYPLIHTTNLKKGKVQIDKGVIVNSTNIITGPAVLLPRVGNFNQEKICYLPVHSKVAISDCIFAIVCDNELHAEEIIVFLLEKWVSFKKIYGGTGALYTTLSKLKKFFDENSVKCI